MFKQMYAPRRLLMSLVLACLVLLAWIPGAFAASPTLSHKLVGPKEHYLALGDSLAFGYQPNRDFMHGYVNDLFHNNLRQDGVKDVVNLACSGETSSTFIKGGICSYPAPFSSQFGAALAYLHVHAGQVSPVTIDIGTNDLLKDINSRTCQVNENQFKADLQTLDTNLTQIILPQLRRALMVNGHVGSDLVMLNFYDPLQNICPNLVSFIQILNGHLAQDVKGFGIIVNIFKAFGGKKVPNPQLCTYTRMCNRAPLDPDIHPTTKGYQVMADAIEERTAY